MWNATTEQYEPQAYLYAPEAQAGATHSSTAALVSFLQQSSTVAAPTTLQLVSSHERGDIVHVTNLSGTQEYIIDGGTFDDNGTDVAQLILNPEQSATLVKQNTGGVAFWRVVAKYPETKNALSYGVMLSDDDDPSTGHNITWDDTHTVRPGAFISGASINLAQSPEPYELTAAMGFDFDGSPDDAIVVEFVETGGATPLISNPAEAKTFDTTADSGSGTVTFSKFEYFKPEAFAIFDASAGALVVNLRVTDGATNVDITESRLKVAQP